MTKISFYHLAEENQTKSACLLLEKCYQGNLRSLVRTSDMDTQIAINNSLWTFAQKAFIPHGSSADPHPALQPIYITTGMENPNQANLLMLIGTLDGVYSDFERILVLIDGRDVAMVTAAKAAYHKLNTPSNSVKYYIQNEKGGWQEE
ncbi:MAG: DNA polymerase III subunit chi [Pseudomonadota bacterium]